MLGQQADAVVRLLRQYYARLRTLECSLACGDDLSPCAGVDISELRLGHGPGGLCLIALGDRLGVVDANEDRAGGDVLTAHDGNLRHSAIDAGSNVEPRRIHL